MSEGPIRDVAGDVEVDVWVVPGASRSEIAGRHGHRLKLRVTSPPEGGRANREAETVLSEALETRVVLTRGMTGRAKTFKVTGLAPEAVLRKLGLS